ncbi:MAG: hemolysin III family protein [Acidimicrobiia bacterium]|nr:hemolysin III family protein [Acidimicrobiia bacterium]
MLATATDPTVLTPRWRGLLHTWWFVLAIPSGALLILSSEQAEARAAASIYAATLLLVFGTSASYHRLARSPRARHVMQRLDHSMIYLLIAGTYTPICLVALPHSWGIPILATVGACAIVGIALKLTAFDRGQVLSFALYPIMGWALIAALPVLADHLSVGQLALIVVGGVAYTIGFPILLVKRPNPWPRTFGYHEIWHLFTVHAGTLHFAAVASVVV